MNFPPALFAIAPFIPPFDARRVFVEPWTEGMPGTLWMLLMAVFIGVPCALLGNYLILRRMALIGDAISHSVLPGLVVAYLIFRDLGSTPMLLGAMFAGLATTLLIEFIQQKSRLKSDVATGITYTTLFALGIFLVNRYAGRVHLDADCVLFGELEYIPLAEPSALVVGSLGPAPVPVVVMAAAAAATALLVAVFYRALLVTSFDAGLAKALGLPANAVHYGLMAVLSAVVVSALESVGLLVVALLVLPGATAQFLTSRLPVLHVLSVGIAILNAALGLHLSAWLNCPAAAAIALCGGGLFLCAWTGSLAVKAAPRRRGTAPAPEPPPAHPRPAA